MMERGAPCSRGLARAQWCPFVAAAAMSSVWSRMALHVGAPTRALPPKRRRGPSPPRGTTQVDPLPGSGRLVVSPTAPIRASTAIIVSVDRRNRVEPGRRRREGTANLPSLPRSGPLFAAPSTRGSRLRHRRGPRSAATPALATWFGRRDGAPPSRPPHSARPLPVGSRRVLRRDRSRAPLRGGSGASLRRDRSWRALRLGVKPRVLGAPCPAPARVRKEPLVFVARHHAWRGSACSPQK
jgi:hypothetical protein